MVIRVNRRERKAEKSWQDLTYVLMVRMRCTLEKKIQLFKSFAHKQNHSFVYTHYCSLTDDLSFFSQVRTSFSLLISLRSPFFRNVNVNTFFFFQKCRSQMMDFQVLTCPPEDGPEPEKFCKALPEYLKTGQHREQDGNSKCLPEDGSELRNRL